MDTRIDLKSDEYPPLERMLSLCFDEFGWAALAGEASRHRAGIGQIVERAALHFASLPSARHRFSRRVPADFRSVGPVVRELPLSLPGRSWTCLIQETERQEVTLERLLEHAALLYLADLDCGQAEPALEAWGQSRLSEAERPFARF